MFGRFTLSRWLVGAAVFAALECGGVITFQLVLTAPAQAQRLDDRYPFLSRQRSQRPSGFFRGFWGGFNDRPRQQEQQSVDHSRAPPPRKPDPKAPPVVPTISIVVMGDGMADWLAYGLEDAFSDSPEIGIVRKAKDRSGLLRYEYKSQLDWWHVARDTLAQEKANYVIMMLGVSDRQNIREKDLAAEDDPESSEGQTDKNAQNKDGNNSDAGRIIAPEPQPVKKSNGKIEFRSDRWVQIYSHRVDETVAALKSKGVPVFWVGLPSIRGTRSTADAVYLNDIYRARAERAGAIYVDVWDGFVDEAGKYSTYGPDYEGQMRRLRSGDGVYFTKAGARKLAHFVERELRRYMNSHVTPVALPAGPVVPAPTPGKSAVRPIAGPVMPLTVTPTNSDELLGSAGIHPTHADATANRVLVKGEPIPAPPGRADDFVWPPGSDRNLAKPEPANASASGAAPSSQVAPRGDAPNAPAKKPAEQKKGATGKTSQNAGEKTKLANEKKQLNHGPPPRPRSRHDPLGWFR